MTHATPFPQSYWVRPGLLCAGHYPGDRDPATGAQKLAGLLDCGVRRSLNLIPIDERGRDGEAFTAYDAPLQALAAERGSSCDCLRMGFPDGHTPDLAGMSAILDRIDASIADGEPIYVHCWGGHGRTSTVIGCHLVRHGDAPEQAIERILAWRSTLPRNWFPFQNGQEAFLRAWRPGQ